MKRTEVKQIDIFYLVLVLLVEVSLVITIVSVHTAEIPKGYNVIDTETVSTVSRKPLN